MHQWLDLDEANVDFCRIVLNHMLLSLRKGPYCKERARQSIFDCYLYRAIARETGLSSPLASRELSAQSFGM